MATEKIEIKLYWSDLIRPVDMQMDAPAKYGIYLWGFMLSRQFTPYYVGIADHIFNRMAQHLAAILSGQYTLYHREVLAQFAQYSNAEVVPVDQKGKIYSPNWPKAYPAFLQQRQALQPHIDAMVDSLVFSYAELNPQRVSKTHLKEIEKACIAQIGKERLANTRGGESESLLLDHAGDKMVLDCFSPSKMH
jgi:hypothetical protein